MILTHETTWTEEDQILMFLTRPDMKKLVVTRASLVVTSAKKLVVTDLLLPHTTVAPVHSLRDGRESSQVPGLEKWRRPGDDRMELPDT